MPYCQRCGAVLDENARFCDKCGTPVAPPVALYVPPPPTRPLLKDPWILFAVALISVLIVAVIAIVIYAAPMFSVNYNQSTPNNYNLNRISQSLPAEIAAGNVVFSGSCAFFSSVERKELTDSKLLNV